MSQTSNSRLAAMRSTLAIAWPLIISNSFWNLQLTIDRIFLGQYSTEALGAAIAVSGIFWTPMALLQQTAAYLSTFVAQYFGAKKHHLIGPATWQALFVSILGGVIFLLLVPLSGQLFSLIGHDPSVQILETEFFQAICFSALPVAVFAAVCAFLSGMGKTRPILWIHLFGLILNVILDYLLIFGSFGFPRLGVSGAGLATTLSSYGSAILGLFFVFTRKNEEQFAIFSGWRWNSFLMRQFLRYGIPSGMQWALEGLAFSVFLILIGKLPQGAAALSSSSIVFTLMMLSILPALGVAQAVSIQVGQALGEKKPEIARSSVWAGMQLALIYIIFVGVTFVVFPNFYLQWFYNGENALLWSDVARLVPSLLMFVAFLTCFDSVNLICSFALKGAGDTRFVSAVALILPWPIMVLPTWYTQSWPNALFWAWAAASLFSMTQGLTFLMRFLGGKWQTMSVIR